MTDEQAHFQPSKLPDARPGEPGGKRHLNRLRKTRELCEAGIAVCLAKGVDAATIDDVVGEAGLSKGSFYRYFDGKEDLVATVFGPVRTAIVDAMTTCADALGEATDDAGLEAAYGQLAQDLLGVLTGHEPAVKLFLQERQGPRTPARTPIREVDDELIHHAIAITHAGRANGLLKPYDPSVSAVAVVGAAVELLRRVFEGDGPDSPAVAAMQLIDLVLHGVRAS